MRVVLAGGSGSLGRRLASAFAEAGDEVVILTRRQHEDLPFRQHRWDGMTVGDWSPLLADALLINLAGELVDRRPTPTNIELLTQSRVGPTTALVAAAQQLEAPPRLWLQMSTLAIYGDGGETLISETHPPADGPAQMAGVARAWEASAQGAAAGRLVTLRTGVVFDRGTPAYQRLRTLTRVGLGGRIGDGQQWMSWIHIDDFIATVRFICDQATLTGIVHVAAPEPIRNGDMMRELRRAFRRPWSPPTPRFAVPIGAAFMRTDPALALTGRRCVPAALTGAGFEFSYPRFAAAIDQLVDTEHGN